MSASVCPGCGLELSCVAGLVLAQAINASAECLQLNGDVVGFELNHPWLVEKCHQMTVDCYGAQHAGAPTKPIRVGYSLVGLHLALDCGLSGIEVRDAHMRMGKPDSRWPVFERPPGFARLTIDDVAAAGLRAASSDGHAAAVEEWANAVWEWWADSRTDVERLTTMVLGDWLASR